VYQYENNLRVGSTTFVYENDFWNKVSYSTLIYSEDETVYELTNVKTGNVFRRVNAKLENGFIVEQRIEHVGRKVHILFFDYHNGNMSKINISSRYIDEESEISPSDTIPFIDYYYKDEKLTSYVEYHTSIGFRGLGGRNYERADSVVNYDIGKTIEYHYYRPNYGIYEIYTDMNPYKDLSYQWELNRKQVQRRTESMLEFEYYGYDMASEEWESQPSSVFLHTLEYHENGYTNSWEDYYGSHREEYEIGEDYTEDYIKLKYLW